MADKEIKITVPEGYEIDRENSTFKCIKFKKKALTYDDVARDLFKLKNAFYINDRGKVRVTDSMIGCYTDATNGVTAKQLEQVLAFNKLLNVAEYLNEGWKPNFKDDFEFKYHLVYNNSYDRFEVTCNLLVAEGHAYFRTKDLARQDIEILGKDEVKKAFGVFQ